MTNIEYVYNSLCKMGYSLRDFGGEYRARPIYRVSGNDMSLVVNKHTGEWYDHSAKIGGQFDSLVKLTTKSLSLTDFNVSGAENFLMTQEAPSLTMPRIFDKNILIKLKKDHSYWIGRGISEFTIDIFEGGTTQNGKMANRYVFPIFDEQENLVGFNGRTLKPPYQGVPKWKIIGDKSHWIYPYRYNKQILLNEKTVILVESIGDMLSLWEAGIKNVIVTFGVEVSDALISFLIKLNFKKIIIAFNNEPDNQNVGLESAEKARIKICKYFDVQQVEIRLPTSKDFNEMPEQQRLNWYANTSSTQCSSVVVNLNKDQYDVYIGRDREHAMHFGNPFDFKNGIGSVKVVNRQEAILGYEEWLRGDPKWFAVEPERRRWILDNLCSLEGKRLGCFCKPEKCHGDVLVTLLQETICQK